MTSLTTLGVPSRVPSPGSGARSGRPRSTPMQACSYMRLAAGMGPIWRTYRPIRLSTASICRDGGGARAE
jgi:hypothetical protein